MIDAMNDVHYFHEVFGCPIADRLGLPDHEARGLRQRLLREEYEEYMEAEEQNDLVEIADALGDMIYIICGTALAYGIPLPQVFAEIQRSNMSKLGADGKPMHRADGKILKGPNYTPPDIATILQHAA
jgi:predicted HAD superfamily Cof-like phosphohydrolase